MKDDLRYWYFRLRGYLITGLTVLLILVIAYLLFFQVQLFLNIVLVVLATFLTIALVLLFGGLIWLGIDKVLPNDPRKSKEDAE